MIRLLVGARTNPRPSSRRVGLPASAPIATAVAVAAALLCPLWTRGSLAQDPPSVRTDTAAIPPGEWDDDWWHPEGRLVLFGQRYSVMLGVTFTAFTRDSARSAFGRLHVSPSVGLYRPETRAGFGPDFDVTWFGRARAGGRARYIAPTLGVRYSPLASPRGRLVVPRLGLRVGPYFARTSVSGGATVLGGNASAGVDIARLLAVTARYDLVRGVRGHDLSTVGLDVVLRFPPGAPRRAVPKMRDRVPPPGRLVDLGTHRLHFVCLGFGSPTVVLDAGMSDAWVVWDRMLPDLARITRVCAYDRAGIGYSDPGPLPRDSRRIAAELRSLLERAGERPPFVLVGHSFGGYNVRLFASEHPELVAGLVLVDATHEDIWERYPESLRAGLERAAEAFRTAAELGEGGARLPPVVPNLPLEVASRPAWYRTLYEESRASRSSAGQVRAARRELAVPVVVVTAGRSRAAGVPRADQAAMRALWTELQADLVRLSPRGEQVVARRSGHYVQRSEPAVVIDAVRRVVEATRAGGVPDAPQ